MRPLLRSEEMILLAVWKLQPDAYGVTIRRYLSQTTGHDWSIASVYVPLDRMTDNGLLKATDQAPTGKRGGRRKRTFALTEKGMATLRQMRTVHDTLWAGFPSLTSNPAT